MNDEFKTFPEALYLWLIANGYKPGLAKTRVGAVVEGGIKTWKSLLSIDFYKLPYHKPRIKGVGEKTWKILRGMYEGMTKDIRTKAYWDLVNEICERNFYTSSKVENILRRNNIDSFFKLQKTSIEQLMNISEVSPKTLGILIYIQNGDDIFWEFHAKEYHAIIKKEEEIVNA